MTNPIQTIAPEPLAKVWIFVHGKWHRALHWEEKAGKLVFTTDGISRITDCEWRHRE